MDVVPFTGWVVPRNSAQVGVEDNLRHPLLCVSRINLERPITMKMPAHMFAIAVGLGLASSAFAVELAAADYLTPRFQVADTYSNVFSISRSIRAGGYDELVGRNGGWAAVERRIMLLNASSTPTLGTDTDRG
jgi:hypothetical protein